MRSEGPDGARTTHFSLNASSHGLLSTHYSLYTPPHGLLTIYISAWTTLYSLLTTLYLMCLQPILPYSTLSHKWHLHGVGTLHFFHNQVAHGVEFFG